VVVLYTTALPSVLATRVRKPLTGESYAGSGKTIDGNGTRASDWGNSRDYDAITARHRTNVLSAPQKFRSLQNLSEARKISQLLAESYRLERKAASVAFGQRD
jgi:hypothetical protein